MEDVRSVIKVLVEVASDVSDDDIKGLVATAQEELERTLEWSRSDVKMSREFPAMFIKNVGMHVRDIFGSYAALDVALRYAQDMGLIDASIRSSLYKEANRLMTSTKSLLKSSGSHMALRDAAIRSAAELETLLTMVELALRRILKPVGGTYVSNAEVKQREIEKEKAARASRNRAADLSFEEEMAGLSPRQRKEFVQRRKHALAADLANFMKPKGGK